ncbi:MAG: UbiD family decarboxylase [Chloroflexi bacterium]|nr:UbiD family decarboxylase [Chloroflexota bacterium]
MSYFKDLREYLAALEEKGKLRRVSRQINKDTELHPLARWQFRGLDESQWAGFLFENLTDVKGNSYNCRVATSIISPSREMYAFGMKATPETIHQHWREAYQHPHPPRLVPSGPVQEEIHIGQNLAEHGGINEFAIPISTNGWEPLPRWTATSWFTRDPDTGVTNIGVYNGYSLGPLRASARNWRGHFKAHWNKCRQRGVPLQAAAVVGAVPAISLVGVTSVPYGMDELHVAGGLAGEPIDVVKCQTVDMEVPATSEIVIEGEIPTDYMEPDPACGEHTGYIIINERVFAFNVTCITHRKNPIWHDIISQMPPSESSTIRGIGAEGRLTSLLKDACGIAQVKDVAFHHCAGAWRLCVVRMQDVGGVRTENPVVWHALLASLSASTDWPKMVIAVDEDIDPWDLESVFWAMSFRYQPHRDTRIIQGRYSSLDQSVGPYDIEDMKERWYPTSRVSPQGASAILMDATRKWDYTPVSLPKRHYMENARKIWEELGFPPLKPREPWHGYSLGVWPDKYQRQAELGERGEFDQVAREIMDEGGKV